MMRTLNGLQHRGLWLAWAAVMTVFAPLAYGDGFDGYFVAHYGDANSDGLTDIYLRWKPEVSIISTDDDLIIPVPSSRRDVPDTLLTQTANGGFLVDPGSASFRQWPTLPAPAFVAVVDFNLDGFMDIGLRGLSSLLPIFPTSLRDQIVYAPQVRGQRPGVVKAIDAAALKFFKELYGWVTNAQYFAQNAPRIPSNPGRYESYLGYILEPYPPYSAAVCVFYDTCEYRFGNIDDPYADPNNTDTKPNVWHWWGITIVNGTSRPDYSVFDERAMGAAALLNNVVLGNEQIVPGGEVEGRLKVILGGVLGVPVYGGIFTGGTPDYVDHDGFLIDRYNAFLVLSTELAGIPGGGFSLPYFNPLANAYINKRDGCTADGRFGMVRNGGTKGHWGVDLGSSPETPVVVGTPVYAVWDGTAAQFKQVSKDKTKLDGYGVQTRLFIPGSSRYFIYAHLSAAVTGRLTRASIAGYVGRTGNLTCEKTHLHFEVKDNLNWNQRIDPASESSVFRWPVEP